MEKTATTPKSKRHHSIKSNSRRIDDDEKRSHHSHSRSYNDRIYNETKTNNNNNNNGEWTEMTVKTKRSTSTISDDSPGSIHYDDDAVDEQQHELVERVPKIKLDDYISSEEETYREKSNPKKSVELNAKLREEIKSGRLGMSDKEELLRKARLSFQADGNELIKIPARSLSPNHLSSSLRSGGDNRFHDDLYFTEDKPSSWLGKTKSDEKVYRK